jgi:hypothetical protein
MKRTTPIINTMIPIVHRIEMWKMNPRINKMSPRTIIRYLLQYGASADVPWPLAYEVPSR